MSQSLNATTLNERQVKLVRMALFRLMHSAYTNASIAARKGNNEHVDAFFADAKDADNLLDLLHVGCVVNIAAHQESAPIPRNERMPALADADPFGMVAWWNSFDNFWVLTNWDSKPARPIFTHWRHTGLIMPPAPGGNP